MQQLTPGPATDRLLVAIVAASGVLATCDEVVAEVADDPARHGGGAYELDRVEALAAHPLAVELGIADTLWRRALSLRHLERVGESSRVALAAPVEHLRWVVARLTDQLTILESALPAAPDGDRLPALPEITEQGLEHQVAVLSDTISRLHAEALKHDRAISEQLLAKDEAIAWLQQVWTEKDKEIIALREEIEWLRGQRSVPERRKW